MASSSTTTRSAVQEELRQRRLARARRRYRYKTCDENQLHPIAVAKSWPWWIEDQKFHPSWVLPFLPNYACAYVHRVRKKVRFAFQRAAFRFDKLRAYQQLLPAGAPHFAAHWSSDAFFAHCRVAGANPLGLRRENDVEALRRRIPFDPVRIEARLQQGLRRTVSLQQEAADGRLFAVDFELIQRSLPRDRTRDSRWREKYLPAPIGVFLEAPGFLPGTALIPVALQIDQFQPTPEVNPVYYPDDGWGWRIAKLYFEVADVSFNAACGHVLRTHLLMEPFCLATARQLSKGHPVSVLLQPHLRFTLGANRGAYDSFVDRSKTYFDFYAGTLEETRQIAIQSRLETDFIGLGLEADLGRRGVDRAPADYPYRDDARLWLDPIRDFVTECLDAIYPSDASVRGDDELQAWYDELVCPHRGALQGLVPGNRLDNKVKLADLLAQVLFTAGPGHASQHYPSNYYYRYAPVFPGAAYSPPPWNGEFINAARHRNTLPPIRTASRQFTYNTFLDYRYDVFGHYDRYPLGRLSEAAGPIARLRARLAAVERVIDARARTRVFPYDFLRPSRVPNSITI
jgi:arachidonate 15-lipoxygenase